MQATLERGWHKLAPLHYDSNIRAWLFGIMHNILVDRIRKPSLLTEELDDHTPMPHVKQSQNDGPKIRDMEYALHQLPTEQREILLIVALEEMTYEEVAASPEIPVGTVMSRLSRAREKLHAVMEGRTVTSPLKFVK